MECDNTADPDESNCFDSLLATGVPSETVQKDAIVKCMWQKGWSLNPVATYIETRQVAQCKDRYPIEACPAVAPDKP